MDYLYILQNVYNGSIIIYMKKEYDIDLMKKLYLDDGLSTVKIADIFDVSWQTILRVLRKNNIQLREPGRKARETKLCGICKKELPRTEFYGKKGYTCKECTSQYNKSHPRLSSRYKRYGISYEKYKIMVEDQGGRCKICGRITEKRLAVDHKHSDGKIRGLLCTYCNTGLGLFYDDVELLKKAVGYLSDDR